MTDVIDIANDYLTMATEHSTSVIRDALRGKGQGQCIDCGVEIPQGRRDALPSAKCCIDCGNLLEMRNNRRAY